jgi:2-dehydropantoate 2-reductase
MNILIYGSGGIGGFLGGLLSKSGSNVHFIARGSHLDAIKGKGLQIKSVHGDFMIQPASVSEEVPSDFDPQYIFICTKSWALPEVARNISQILTQNTVVVFFQNGINNFEVLSEYLPSSSLIPATIKVVSTIDSPGVIIQKSQVKDIQIGEMDGQLTDRCQNLQRLLADATLNVTISSDINLELWKKFIFISAFSGMTALTQKTIGVIMQDDVLRRQYHDCLQETYDVAKCSGVAVSDEIVSQLISFSENLESNLSSSLHEDIKNNKKSELDTLTGVVVELGKKYGISTPVNQLIYQSLKTVVNEK